MLRICYFMCLKSFIVNKELIAIVYTVDKWKVVLDLADVFAYYWL